MGQTSRLERSWCGAQHAVGKRNEIRDNMDRKLAVFTKMIRHQRCKYTDETETRLLFQVMWF